MAFYRQKTKNLEAVGHRGVRRHHLWKLSTKFVVDTWGGQTGTALFFGFNT
jgi:hypothetical protein